jgi:anti-sigma factor RsiW
MRCRQAKRLYGSYWDDEITQAEREWLEAHFAACAPCRAEYETFARSLELLGTLPRIEPSPDLAERALARARRASTAPDRIPTASIQWAPIAATAAVLLTLATFMSPWIAPANRLLDAGRMAQSEDVSGAQAPASSFGQPVAVEVPPAPGAPASSSEPIAAMSDSLFDRSEDVEFILDPVAVRRGQPSIRPRPQVQGEHAVISF